MTSLKSEPATRLTLRTCCLYNPAPADLLAVLAAGGSIVAPSGSLSTSLREANARYNEDHAPECYALSIYNTTTPLNFTPSTLSTLTA
jgi:hypothetical protein